MSRFSVLRSYNLLRQHRSRLVQPKISPIYSLSTLKSSRPSPSQVTPNIPFSGPTIPHTAPLFLPNSTAFRPFSSDSELPSNMVLINSQDQLNDSLKKVEDEFPSAVFYFTAVWCGPCRFIWPEIKKLSESLPNVKFYKIDIDEVGGGPTLNKLNIFSVPTLHFFKNGKKVAEVIGADAKKIKDVSSSLY